MAEQDRSVVWGEVASEMLAAIVHVSPLGVDADTDRLTVSVNPFTAFRVMVEVPESPARIWLGVTGPAEMLNSGVIGVVMWKVMLAVE